MKCQVEGCEDMARYWVYKAIKGRKIWLINICRNHVWEAFHLAYHNKLREGRYEMR